jgi:hypothetical protein
MALRLVHVLTCKGVLGSRLALTRPVELELLSRGTVALAGVFIVRQHLIQVRRDTTNKIVAARVLFTPERPDVAVVRVTGVLVRVVVKVRPGSPFLSDEQ